MPTGKDNTHHNFKHPIHLTTFCTSPTIAKGDSLTKEPALIDAAGAGATTSRVGAVASAPPTRDGLLRFKKY
jgi:hypothetical protein